MLTEREEADEARKPYWETLQRIAETCAVLQRSPIPLDKIGQRLNLMRLRHAEHEMREMLREVGMSAGVWSGSPGDLGGRRSVLPESAGTTMLPTSEEYARLTK